MIDWKTGDARDVLVGTYESAEGTHRVTVEKEFGHKWSWSEIVISRYVGTPDAHFYHGSDTLPRILASVERTAERRARKVAR